MLNLADVNKQITFSGATRVAPLADKQTGATCGFEAIENIIQLFLNVGNNLVEADLLPRALARGVAMPGAGEYRLSIHGYLKILEEYGIPARWYPFDYRQVVIPAQWNNRGVLVVGDAHYLNPQMYPRQLSWHAFVLTNYYTDQSGYHLIGYIGLDSNVPKTEVAWPFQSVESAASWAAQGMGTPVLVTEIPFNWPSRAKYYRLDNTGQLEPIY